eukprot:1544332-Pyramimonas_sp.AAC.1
MVARAGFDRAALRSDGENAIAAPERLARRFLLGRDATELAPGTSSSDDLPSKHLAGRAARGRRRRRDRWRR